MRKMKLIAIIIYLIDFVNNMARRARTAARPQGIEIDRPIDYRFVKSGIVSITRGFMEGRGALRPDTEPQRFLAQENALKERP
jgi:hypothetical protein